MNDILTRLVDWISFEFEFTGKEPDVIRLSEYHWDEFRKALKPLGIRVRKNAMDCLWMGVRIIPKEGDKPMIKSFHQKGPTAVHTYLVLEEVADGVVIRAVKENGDFVKDGQICFIGSTGVTLRAGVNRGLNIQIDDNGNPVTRDHRDRVLMSVDEYRLRGNMRGKNPTGGL